MWPKNGKGKASWSLNGEVGDQRSSGTLGTRVAMTGIPGGNTRQAKTMASQRVFVSYSKRLTKEINVKYIGYHRIIVYLVKIINLGRPSKKSARTNTLNSIDTAIIALTPWSNQSIDRPSTTRPKNISLILDLCKLARLLYKSSKFHKKLCRNFAYMA